MSPKQMSPEQAERQAKVGLGLAQLCDGRKLKEMSALELATWIRNNSGLGYRNIMRAPGGLFTLVLAEDFEPAEPVEQEDTR